VIEPVLEGAPIVGAVASLCCCKFVAILTQIARNSGASGYIGDGANRWPAVHVLDAAPLYLEALTHPPTGAVLHSVAEEGITNARDRRGDRLGAGRTDTEHRPNQATAHFGFLAMFFALDLPPSSELTRATYDWHPAHPGLLDDLNVGLHTRGISTAGTPN
jgi:hypothetical protein